MGGVAGVALGSLPPRTPCPVEFVVSNVVRSLHLYFLRRACIWRLDLGSLRCGPARFASQVLLPAVGQCFIACSLEVAVSLGAVS